MQICPEHWRALRAEVARRGLANIFVLDCCAPFAALQGARLSIMAEFAHEHGGACLDRPGCPLCTVGRESFGLDREWIKVAVSDQVGYACALDVVRLH